MKKKVLKNPDVKPLKIADVSKKNFNFVIFGDFQCNFSKNYLMIIYCPYKRHSL